MLHHIQIHEIYGIKIKDFYSFKNSHVMTTHRPYFTREGRASHPCKRPLSLVPEVLSLFWWCHHSVPNIILECVIDPQEEVNVVWMDTQAGLQISFPVYIDSVTHKTFLKYDLCHTFLVLGKDRSTVRKLSHNGNANCNKRTLRRQSLESRRAREAELIEKQK